MFDVQGAKKAGYSDAEIAEHLGQQSKFDVAAARKAGYSDTDIIGHLSKGSKAQPKAKPSVAKDVGKQYLSGLAEGVAGISDMVMQANPFGTVTGMLGNAANLAELTRGRSGPNITAAPLSTQQRAITRAAPKAETRAGRYARTGGQMTLNAVAPGGAARRVANVVLPAVGSEAAAEVAEAAGANPFGVAAARTGGALAGAALSSANVRNPFRERAPAELIARRARQDPAAMTQRAEEYRAAGIEPTLTDVVDDAGRGAIRAAASRMTEGRDQANVFARSRTLNLPDRMSTQARRTMSADPRTPDEIRTSMAQQRSQNAAQAFGAVRGETIPLADETVAALRTDYGRGAIREAASRERDPEIRAALNRLTNDVLDQPGQTQITIGMADRISRVLNGQAQAAGRSGDNELAGLLGDLAGNIRNPARQASPGYQAALEGFAADSRLQEAAGVGENMLRRNTDEFAAQAQRLGPEERALAQAAGRRAIERAAGENPSSAAGVARRIAEAPEQQARNAALLGPEGAQNLQQGMRLEAQAVDNANMIAPRTGSWTQQNTADASRMAGALRVGGQLVRRDFLGLATDWLRSRGMSDDQARALIEMAVDPAQTDRAIEIIGGRYGQEGVQQLLQWRNAAVIGAASTASTAAAQSAPAAQ